MTPQTLTQPRELLAELLAKMGIDATVEQREDDPPLLEIVDVEDPATLIGHRGEAIRSLQHVLRVMVARAGGSPTAIVDVDGYRSRQQGQLKETAKQKAEEVKQTGRLTVLSPMTSYERRLVHVELRDDPAVTTESIGEGGSRRVMIKKVEG
ncbi:MAG: hypothetical protein M3N59_00375 [bacterium]|nr:hypothetical protein [bacterium]